MRWRSTSAGIYDDSIASDCATIEEKTGNKMVEFSDADVERIWLLPSTLRLTLLCRPLSQRQD